MLERGADVAAANLMGRQPLHYAANRAIVECLIDAGADVNARDLVNDTALLHATLLGHVDDVANVDDTVTLMQALIDHGADVDARDQHGYSALHNCALYT